MKFSALTKFAITSVLLASAANIAFAGHRTAANDYKDTYKDAVYKDAVPCPTLMGGFYVGAQAGYEAFRVRQSYSDADESGFDIHGLTGWMGGLFLGYGQYFNNMYYLGAEVLGNYSGANQTLESGLDGTDPFTGKLRARQTWGLSVLPGLRLNNTTLAYVRLGYDWTKFEGTVSGATSGVAYSTSASETLGGFDFGVGMETLICDNWSVRAEFNHVWYEDLNRNTANGGRLGYNPSDNQFTVGVLYRFM